MTIDKPEPKLNPEGYENMFVNTKKPLPDLSKGFSDFDPDPNNSNLDTKQRRRLLERAEWEAFWKIPDNSSKHFWMYLVDRPVSWFREKSVEPLNEKCKCPYYHLKRNRCPDIDQCGPLDKVSLVFGNV